MVKPKTLWEVKQLVLEHLQEQRRLPESARQRDLGSEKALVRDYSGRVVYELLQNALDRADKTILVRWTPREDSGGQLLVGNDGLPVTAFERPTIEDAKPSDLHSLLSLHSSTKTAQESVGNKGVGFRSVFASSRTARICSRAEDGLWWGLQLDHPDSVVPASDVEWNSQEVASFYGPEWLDEVPDWGVSDLVTVVSLDDVPPEQASVIVETIRYLKNLPPTFLERRARFRDGRLRIRFEEGAEPSVEMQVHLTEELAPGHAESGALAVPKSIREVTGLDLDKAEVRVLLAPESKRTGDVVYWSYLPTEQESGHGAHIHADFYLNNSRRNVVFSHVAPGGEIPPSPAGWNGWLLQKAADVLVDVLWRRAEVCGRADFWHMVSPKSCSCRHLRDAVTLRLATDPDRMRELVRDGFERDPGDAGWTVRRYHEFFDVLESWAVEAYHLQWQKHGQPLDQVNRQYGGHQQYKWRERLRTWVRESGARVIPIVDRAGEDLEAPVARAMPIPPPTEIGKPAALRIYLRKTEGFPVPDALMRQNTFVTVFAPPHSKNAADFGLLEFTRTELLANIAPGTDDDEHEQLLGAAFRLALEEPERGGFASVAARAHLDYGHPVPFWRFATPDRNLGKAGAALARLFVPTRDGEWRPASEVVVADTWPERPEVDADRLLRIGQELGTERPENKVRLEELCGLLGIGGVPLTESEDASPSIDGWLHLLHSGGEALARAARSVVGRWRKDLDCLVRPGFLEGRNAVLREQLQNSPWVVDTLTPELCGGELDPGVHGAFPLVPGEMWWQDPRRGVRTKLLPRLECDSAPPRWASALGVSGLGRSDRDSEDRPARALRALKLLHHRHACPSLDLRFDFEQTYTRLIEILPDGFEGAAEVPVLVRRYDSQRKLRENAWADPREESVWHDAGEQSHALAAFRDYSLWVVRRGPKRLATAMGIKEFAPDHPVLKTRGEADLERRDALVNRLVAAFPDMFAAAAIAPVSPRFDEKEALRRQAILTVRHAEDAFLLYRFDEKEGDLGRDEEGDVFMVPECSGEPAHLVFDGCDGPLPLIDCARPLSELLCDNRAFVSVFKDALVAWSQAGDSSDGGASVRRFRRDHALSEEDIHRWSRDLLAHRMNAVQREEWTANVFQVLSSFGHVEPSSIKPGATITPAFWRAPHGEGAIVTESHVAQALRDALTGAGVPEHSLVPAVSFTGFHLQEFRKLNLTLFVAAAAEESGRSRWNEELYEDLWCRVRAELNDEERTQFQTLGCDVAQVMCRRLGLEEPLPEERVSPAALAFARGQIPLGKLPDAPAMKGTLVSWSNVATPGGREPLAGDAWMKKARRQATGGGRAENAVLALAKAEAQRWLHADASTFLGRVSEALAPFLGSTRVRQRLASVSEEGGSGALDKLLHVSSYIGDAGFDLLVPRAAEQVVQRVEVKRVSDLGSAVFYLSENERRQALALAPNWHLWLVSGDGRSRDVSWLRQHLEEGDLEVDSLLRKGLRPNDWLFHIHP